MRTQKENEIRIISFSIIWIAVALELILALTSMSLYENLRFPIGGIGFLAVIIWWVLLDKKEKQHTAKAFSWGKTIAKVIITGVVTLVVGVFGLHWLAGMH